MLLSGANAVVYGAGGVVGSAVALALARGGARVHLAGRSRSRLDTVVRRITDLGGHAEAQVIDVLDEVDVDEYVDVVAACSGSIDISVDLVGPTPFGEHHDRVDHTELAELEGPVLGALRSHFITARAAARHMVCQHSGVILVPHRAAVTAGLDGASLAAALLDRLAEQLAGQLASSGVIVRPVDLDPSESGEDIGRRVVAAVTGGDSALAAV
ncbi:SDR family NAD(P)-dependent oxidoreductase [Rhodococcoides corynebacterioides]|uniref:SDR family NAD(P)-dependent oxidoreductase n=1 Tax=Rhodococcoides corynebacterioides TaxID=53972 RepID=A0ABS7P754_9NOCA|nr:SDR family NAD(P)-dependent oxidoreductase [Rhodococcus corynebacterioides]MBY6368254.1 SDR family NAD(P)-dependent oxidoreductase [Rhodococcus corynebacterioides]MBY6409181.1 SDR family NAD(P)-dependent oxidoreductase [Rhodococcus corynebacterioides]